MLLLIIAKTTLKVPLKIQRPNTYYINVTIAENPIPRIERKGNRNTCIFHLVTSLFILVDI